MMAMSLHSRWMGVTIDAISATGGASANREILQVMADVFEAPVQQLVVGNSACLGAALRAAHADHAARGQPMAWEDVIRGFVTPRSTPIVPAKAHADGYRRHLSNTGRALLHGREARVVGAVTMDMTLVDVTGHPCGVGDIVTLIGSDDGTTLSVEDVARDGGLSPYELLTGLRQRLPRVYRSEPGV